jgi:sarcosine oxidase
MNRTSKEYDVIVIGVGGMGSAITYHLARRQIKVLGLERYDIPHTMGSSHGVTRIIRLAYYEHPSYVPLLRRAYELWHELERMGETRLLHKTGSIDAGPADGRVFPGSVESCRVHDIPQEILTSPELTRRFPACRLPAGTMAVFQPDGGFLIPELCIAAHVKLAQAHGAEIHAREQVLDWEVSNERVLVRTERATYAAERLIIAAGAWVGKLVQPLSQLAVPERQVLGWFQPFRPEWFSPDCFPVFNLELPLGHYYVLPVFGVPGVKIGKYHHLKEPINPDHPVRECRPADEEILRDCMAQYFPEGAGPTMALRACMFTNTPDEHFIVDYHPDSARVLIASPCSGHGFKFCSVIGEIIADLAERDETQRDISLFRLARFNQPSP